MVPFSNGRWTLYSEVIKKDEYDESVHSSSRPLLSDSTHRERYYESATHHVNTPKRTGTYCCLPQVGGAAAFAAVVRCKIRGVGWRGSLLLQTHKHCIQQQRSIGWLRCKKATAIQQKKHVVAECVGASWSLCQAGLLLLSVAVSCQIRMWFLFLVWTFGLLDPHNDKQAWRRLFLLSRTLNFTDPTCFQL